MAVVNTTAGAGKTTTNCCHYPADRNRTSNPSLNQCNTTEIATTETQLRGDTHTELPDSAANSNSRRSTRAFQSKDGNFQVGELTLNASSPQLHTPVSTGRSGITLGGIAVSATALEGQMQQSTGPASINAKVTVGSLEAQASAEFSKDAKNDDVDISVSVGAEAIAFETTVGIDLTLSSAPINNLWRNVYKHTIDPAVDFIVGKDVPEVPSPLATLNGSLLVSGKLSSGWGSALNVGAALQVEGNEYSLRANAKFTPTIIGPTTGAALAITIK